MDEKQGEVDRQYSVINTFSTKSDCDRFIPGAINRGLATPMKNSNNWKISNRDTLNGESTYPMKIQVSLYCLPNSLDPRK